jgi:hypothetical protein
MLEIGYLKTALNRLKYLSINKEVLNEKKFVRNYWNDYWAIDLPVDNNWTISNDNVDDWTLR